MQTAVRNTLIWASLMQLAFVSPQLFAEQTERSQAENPPTTFDVSALDYPRAFFFRVPQRNIHAGYEAWDKEYSRLNGMISKVGFEELHELPHDTIAEYMTRFAHQRPEQFVNLHFNSFARDPLHPSAQEYFPGHWLYGPGATLTMSISAQDTILSIDKQPSQRFILDGSFGSFKGTLNDELVLVPLDEQGNKRWEQAEYLLLEAMDDDAQTLTVARGHANSNARPFAGGQAYVAPVMTMGPYGIATSGNRKLWVYNFSLDSPLDQQGRSAADVFALEMGQWFGPNGEFRDFAGVALDLPFWDISRRAFLKPGRKADANNDGVADGAVIEGRNHWEAGVRGMYAKLRGSLGEGYVVTADAQQIENQRAVDILSGLEMEGLVDHKDGDIGISSTVNQVAYWQMFGEALSPWSYTFYKDNSDDPRPELDKARFAFTMSQNLGMLWGINKQITDPEPGFDIAMLDEVRKGIEQEKNWLGQPIEAMQRTGLTLPDVLNGAGETFNEEFVSTLSSRDGELTINGDEVLLVSRSDKQKATTLTLSEIAIPEGDITVYFEAKALQPLTLADGQDVDSPYRATIEFSGHATPEDIQPKPVLSYVGHQGFFLSEAYLRAAGASEGETRLTINIVIEGAGAFALKAFRVTSGTPLYSREFEHGAVISNPSMLTQCVDSAQLFSSDQWRRIQGEQDPTLNSGAALHNGQVCVPSVNGIVLSSD